MSAQLPESDVTSALSILERLDDDELKRLINQEDAFDTFIRKLPQVERWENDKEVLLASNKSLAEYNLTFESKLKEGKETLIGLYENVRKLSDELSTKQAQLESLGSRSSLDTTHALLLTAAAEVEEESDKLSEEFIGGTLDLDSFLASFIPLRQKAHLRKLKADKLGDLIKGQRARTNYGAATPYPTSSPFMPTPHF